MVALGFVVLCACWSTTWYAIRLCLQGYPPFYGAALRFLLAAALLALGAALWRRLRGAAARGPLAEVGNAGLLRVQGAIALAGVANGLAYALVYLAERDISGGTAAVISATNPFFAALAARLAGLERLLPRRLLGVLIGFVGIALLMVDGLDKGAAQLSAMAGVALSAAVLWPLYGVLLKRYGCALPALRTCALLLGYTGATLLLLAVLYREPLPQLQRAPVAAHLGLLYLTLVGSVVAWTVYLWLLRRLDLSVLSAMGLIQPVLALLLDVLVGDVDLRGKGYLGAALVLVGVAMAALRGVPHLTRRRARAPRPAPAPAAHAVSQPPLGTPSGAL